MKNIYLRIAVVVVMLVNMQNVILAQDKLRIAVIPKSGGALFWKSVKMGAKLGAAALSGVEIVWEAPATEDNTEQQISIVDKCTADGVSGIILSPINQDALVKPVARAMDKKIPVLIFDSELKGTAGKDFISFVGINNRKAGALAGEHLAKLLRGSGNVVLLRYVKGQANTTAREEGFIDAISRYKGIKLLEKETYAGGTVEEAKKASKDLLMKFNDANGIFCPNEQSTIGMLEALQEESLAGKKIFVGFDTPSPVIEALKKGEISAVIAQDPARIGFQSVKTLVDYIRTNKAPTKVDINVQVVTKENVNNPEIKKILSLPSLSE
jgi:ribose transport system substrate-binding protein